MPPVVTFGTTRKSTTFQLSFDGVSTMLFFACE